jgi:steroid delta-isomerase
MMQQLLHTIQSDLAPEQVTAAVNSYLESWRNGDSQARAALFAENAVVEDPVGAPAIQGQSALLAFWQRAAAYPTRFDPTLESILVCGNEAIVKFSMHMDVLGIASGTLHIIENFRLDKSGKIAQLRAFWDENSVS